jgi:hypothetical protein
MKPIFLCDLDDSLFQTLEKCPPPAQDLTVMSFLADGSPSGYATPRQRAFMAYLSLGRLIPVTARSTGVLARVNISQAPAICSNGGCILGEDGGLDRTWHDHLVGRAQGDHAVGEVYQAMTASLDPAAFRHWVVTENDLPLYIVIKSNKGSAADLIDLAAQQQAHLPASWRRHSNGNNLAYMPAWLNKRHAAAYLIEQIRADAPDTPIIGIGDSVSDVGFMDLCDYAATPTASQFWRAATQNNDWLR